MQFYSFSFKTETKKKQIQYKRKIKTYAYITTTDRHIFNLHLFFIDHLYNLNNALLIGHMCSTETMALQERKLSHLLCYFIIYNVTEDTDT